MNNALNEGTALTCDTVQVFTKNQQQWRVPALAPETVEAWKLQVSALGWQDRIVSHASYLINLATPDDELWRKSIDLMTIEIERCEQLGIPILVHHPGSFTTSAREQGLARIAAAYETIFERTPGFRTSSCLENTVGSGSHLGREFQELAELRGAILRRVGPAHSRRVGFCFDTCHAHAGGYDMSTEDSARDVLDQFAHHCGMENLRALHLNDSKGACGSRLDRHEHIGHGTIGYAGFAAVVRRSDLAGKPMILETPKEESPDGRPWDAVNLEALRTLQAGGMPKTAPASDSAKPAAKPRARVVGKRPVGQQRTSRKPPDSSVRDSRRPKRTLDMKKTPQRPKRRK